MAVVDDKILRIPRHLHGLISSLKNVGLRQKEINTPVKSLADVITFLFENWLNSDPVENIKILNRDIYFPVPGYATSWDKPIVGQRPKWISISEYECEEEEAPEIPRFPIRLIVQHPQPKPVIHVPIPDGEAFDSTPCVVEKDEIPPNYPSDEEVISKFNEDKLELKRVSLREMR